MRSPVWKVAKFEFVRQIKKPAFWVSILIMPVLMVGIFLIGLATGNTSDETPMLDENATVLITDEVGVLGNDVPYTTAASREEGIQMVKDGEVDLYFYIPGDFLETRKAEFYHISEGLDLFNMDANVLKGIMAGAAAERVSTLDVLAISGDYEIADNKLTANGEDANVLGKAAIPIAILVVYFVFVALFGNRFLLAVVEEKENRISEMIMTSVSTKHLIVGKMVAMMALGVVQIATLVVPALILVMINRENPMVAMVLSAIEIDPVATTMNVILFIAAMFFYAGTCMLVGSMVSTARDASSFIGPAIIAQVLPLYFMQLFLAGDPDLIVHFLTYFPLSAPIALMLRSAFGTLSTVEFAIGTIEVVVFAIITTRLAIVTFQRNALNFEVARLKWMRKK